MEKPAVSIVVPIYNVEKYLDRCVESLLNQTLRNIEIILVDDGSPDKCPELCDYYKSIDNRVKVVHKKNGGLGLARNSGINVARGDYIGFIDSDDYISTDYFEKLYENAIAVQADACIGGMTDVYYDVEIPYLHILSGNTYVKNQVCEKVLPTILGYDEFGQSYAGMSVCKGIYSLETIRQNEIKFPSEREYISEDVIFSILFYKVAKSVIVCDSIGYYYCHRSEGGSLTTSYRNDRFSKNKTLYLYEKSLLDGMHNFNELHMRIQNMFIANLRVLIMQESKIKQSFKSALKRIDIYLSDPLVKEILESYDFSNLPKKQKIFCTYIKRKMSLIVYIMAYLQSKKHKRS